MKRHRFAATALLCCALTVSGCGIIRTVGAIGSLFGGHKKASTVVTVVKILGSVLGQFYDTTTKTALVGNWTYDEPAIQFESENLLKKAGGAVASQGVADKLSPYFEMIGFKPGDCLPPTATLSFSGRSFPKNAELTRNSGGRLG